MHEFYPHHDTAPSLWPGWRNPFPWRVMSPLLAALLVVSALAFGLYARMRTDQDGLFGFISAAVAGGGPVRAFALTYATRILLPVYGIAALLVFGLSWGWAMLWDRHWARTWSFMDGFWVTFGALVAMHVILWWQVPTTLAVLPGLRALPFYVLLPLLAALACGTGVWVLMRRSVPGLRRLVLAVGWLGLWSLFPLMPSWLPAARVEPRGGADPCEVLVVGLDGLRSDVFAACGDGFHGRSYPNAYSPIPATRLLWHVLWGGEPLYYTVGHAPPSLEEFSQSVSLPLLHEAHRSGWKPRFYIDDGGTIGLAGRSLPFDDVLMPARGWENFVNSNLAASFPLYAAWENSLKPFPTTNPWVPLDAGLREALRLGRGSRWVMYHSCLVHQPIFLTRRELQGIRDWWGLSPHKLLPVSSLKEADVRPPGQDPRWDPYTLYKIRMKSVLDAWKPVWNALQADRHYSRATRFLFSDHGERFYPVPSGGNLQGVHGFSLDPWETRVAFLVDGPGFPAGRSLKTVSLLALREVVASRLREAAPDAHWLEGLHPRAPMRYHTLDTSAFEKPNADYRVADLTALALTTSLAPDGLWFCQYSRPVSERSKHVSVGVGEGDRLTIFRPLKEGGAMESVFEGVSLIRARPVSEDVFQQKKTEIERLFEQ